MTMNWQDVSKLFSQLQFDDAPVGGALVVHHRGECVIDEAFGQANPDKNWDSRTLSVNFSIGKGVMSTLIAVLVSRGVLSYATPISEYWTRFGINGKHNITLLDILTHTSGLFDVSSLMDNNEQALSWVDMLTRIEEMSIQVPEGQTQHNYGSAYSALVSGWVLGGLIEHATGQNLQTVLDEYLAKPLGVVGELYYGLPSDKLSQVAVPYRLFDKQNATARRKPVLKPDTSVKKQFFADLPFAQMWQEAITNNGADELNTASINRLYFDTSKMNMVNYKSALVPDGKTPLDYHHEAFLQVPIPAANGVSTAHALAKMYQMHANDGKVDDIRLISDDVIAKIRRVYTQGFDAVMPADMGWRLGFHRVFGLRQAEHAYGHMGYNGSVAFCDPSRELAVAFIHNFDTTMLNDVRQFVLIEAILKAADDLNV